MTNLTSALSQLEQERTHLTSQLESLNRARSALNGTGSKRTSGSTWAFTPITDSARRFFDENISSEPWQWLGANLVVDHSLLT